MLQQYLPFTVLKQNKQALYNQIREVATVLTVYGIETDYGLRRSGILHVATVPTACGMRRRERDSRGAKRR